MDRHAYVESRNIPGQCRECGHGPLGTNHIVPEGAIGKPEDPRKPANERQVGGDHYKTGGEEHWDRIWRLYGRGYFVGCITKYVERYHKKAGIQDLEKAAHFLQKLIELEKSGKVRPGEEYTDSNLRD